MTPVPMVRGWAAAEFAPVRNAFASATARRPGGFGAQLAVFHRGDLVVDLWAGEGVEADSLTGDDSFGEGVVRLTAALLVQEGLVGVEHSTADRRPESGPRVAARTAFRRAARGGSVGGPLGETVFRATGRTVEEHYERRLRRPLGIDLYLGLPESERYRYLPAPGGGPSGDRREGEGDRGPGGDGPGPNCGVGNARGAASLYSAAVSGTGVGEPFLDRETLEGIAGSRTPRTGLEGGEEDGPLLGAVPGVSLPFPGDRAFGHGGATGSLSFADPDAGIAYAFVRRGPSVPAGYGVGENVPLVAAVAEAAGWTVPVGMSPDPAQTA